MRTEFQVHMLNAQGLTKANLAGEIFSRCLDEIETLVGDSCELSLVRTKLQEASFFTKRAIAQHPLNQLRDALGALETLVSSADEAGRRGPFVPRNTYIADPDKK